MMWLLVISFFFLLVAREGKSGEEVRKKKVEQVAAVNKNGKIFQTDLETRNKRMRLVPREIE